MEEKNNYKQSRKSKKFWVLNIIILFCAVVIGIFLGQKGFGVKKGIGPGLTNPILNTSIGENLMNNKNINLEYYLNDYERVKIANGDITDLSVYFRNFNNGNRFGVKEKALFSPASLMKLPLLLAYFKKDETENGFLQRKLIFTKNGTSDNYKQNIMPSKRLQVGKEYKLIDIINQMIEYSDNEASIFLEKNIEIDEFKRVFTDIGIEFPPITDGQFDNNIRVVDYSSFFRVLFNSSYLNRENSEKVLNMLTKTKFKDGLVAGISDENILISHKFGERSIFGNNGIERKQLHDCGIVYYPDHPYLLCIMTRGYDRNKLKSVLQEVSSIVFEKVDDTYNN
ncbi:MAG: serine hydrolase [Candidatus Absconditicoccaceae bacterium]